MPLYSWKDKKTGLIVEILRSFSDYKEEPRDEDLSEEEKGRERDWERLVGANIHVSKSASWGPGKGNWGK